MRLENLVCRLLMGETGLEGLFCPGTFVAAFFAVASSMALIVDYGHARIPRTRGSDPRLLPLQYEGRAGAWSSPRGANNEQNR
ncbi:hypothetical protein CKAH01_11861 [Colletotrichum kahawae]|uniref:Uncharacterized protein n=1 Tax=Colletotrichum kahawae TaxID=34407 RepID=A0AAE0DFV1_COLKA|nr:hypothetical protein CKAH01_11861 [Colletotrichum kahawae]